MRWHLGLNQRELSSLITNDEMVGSLWGLWKKVKEEGLVQVGAANALFFLRLLLGSAPFAYIFILEHSESHSRWAFSDQIIWFTKTPPILAH